MEDIVAWLAGPPDPYAQRNQANLYTSTHSASIMPCDCSCFLETASVRRSPQRLWQSSPGSTVGLGLGLDIESREIGFVALESSGTTLPACRARAGARGRRRDPGSGVALRLPAPHRGRNQPVRPNCAPGSGSTPTFGPVARGRISRFCASDGSRSRAGEHRRLLLRPEHVRRVRASSCRTRTRLLRAQGDGDRHLRGGAYRVRARPRAPSARHRRAQGQRAEAVRRSLPPRGPPGRRGLSRRRARRAHRRRGRGSSHPPPGQLRRDRHHQHVRRHLVRRGVRAQRKPRSGRISQRRRRHRRRSGPARIGARHRGSERGQSHLLDPLGGDAAAVDRPTTRRRPVRGRRLRIEEAVEAVLAGRSRGHGIWVGRGARRNSRRAWSRRLRACRAAESPARLRFRILELRGSESLVAGAEDVAGGRPRRRRSRRGPRWPRR